jgi:glutathione synthase/RimK-type ligase-like ATP-grasp enzyme
MPKVLILGGRAPVALDHARRFAHQGWQVLVADSVACQISGASRAVTATLRHAAPRPAPLQFAEDLRRAALAHRIDLIVPTCEEVFYVARYRERLPLHTRVLAEHFETLRAVHSKWRFLSLAAGCGAQVPESMRVTSLAEARAWAGDRPVVLKPEFSRFGVHVRLYRTGIPSDAPPLAALGPWVVQQYLAGQEFCSYSVADRGRLVAHSVYRPGWRMSTSASFYFEAARVEAIRRFAANFARKLDFTGQLSFDWIQHADGRVSVLECNPRATSGCHLFTRDDALPAALHGTLATCIEPSSPAPRMVTAAMLTAGLGAALRHGRLAQWLRDYRAATDVIVTPGDRGPLWGGVRDLAAHARLAMLRRCTLREAMTQDIEWDGEALPEP